MYQPQKYKNNAAYFWNDYKNIEWFKKEPIPPYWLEFFSHEKSKMIDKVLDLGCGAGRNTEMLFRLGYEVYACDLYQNMITVTKNRLLQLGMDRELVRKHIFISDMTKLNFSDGKFDYIVSNGVYHNAYTLNEFEKAIIETTRILKNNGKLCFNIFSSEYIDASFKKIDDFIYSTTEGLIMVLINKENFINICEKYGLKIFSPIVEYRRKVTTGTRSVMRGILIKK